MFAISDRCVHVKKLIEIIRENFGEIPEHENKLRECINKISHIVEKKQDQLCAGGTVSSVMKHFSELFIETLPPEEFPEYYQKIQAVQSIIERHGKCSAIYDFRQMFEDVWKKLWNKIETNLQKQENKLKPFVTDFWNIIQNNRHEEHFLLEKQCDDIERLTKFTQENFKFQIPEHEKKPTESIRKIWHTIDTIKLKEDDLEVEGYRNGSNPGFGLVDGIEALGYLVERVLKLIRDTLPPEELFHYTENIKRCVQAVSNQRNNYMPHFLKSYKDKFYRTTTSAVEKFCEEIEKKSTEADSLLVIERQCDYIEKIIELIAFVSSFSSYSKSEKYRSTMVKIYEIIETKLS